MTKKLKYGLGLLALVVGLAIVAKPVWAIVSRALAPQDNFAFEMPKDINAQPDIHRAWAKASTFAIGGVGTTCNLVYAGKGIIAGASGWGQPSDQVVAFDASAVGSLSAATPDTSKVIAFFDVDTAKVNPSDVSPITGFPFLNGLVLCPKTSTAYLAIRYFKQQ